MSVQYKIQRKAAWKIAIGLQDVDRLQPSELLLQLAQDNIDGKISFDEILKELNAYYSGTSNETRSKEADYVSVRIAQILLGKPFPCTVASVYKIHEQLFKDVFPHAGQMRTYNISKKEAVLQGDTVLYSSSQLIGPTLEYDFAQECQINYKPLSQEEKLKRVCKFIAGIWQIHPFGEGNTRTTAVFALFYLQSLGFSIYPDAFYHHSHDFRDALVLSNYTNDAKGFASTTEYLENFLKNSIK